MRGWRSAPRSVSALAPAASLNTTADCGPSLISPPATSQRPSGSSVALCPSPTAAACGAAARFTAGRGGAAVFAGGFGDAAGGAVGAVAPPLAFFAVAVVGVSSRTRLSRALAAECFFILFLRLV
jgi:hypothetical protein